MGKHANNAALNALSEETQETNYLVPLRVGIGLKNADILT